MEKRYLTEMYKYLLCNLIFTFNVNPFDYVSYFDKVFI